MWLRDLRIVLPDQVLEHGSVRIEEGIITEIVEGATSTDIPGIKRLTLIPGLIDLHGDMLEREVLPRPTARFPTELALMELDKRLASCGITTAYAAVSFAWKDNNLRSKDSAIEMINTIDEINHKLLIDMKVHARFEVTNPVAVPILTGLLETGKIQLVSVMDHTPGQGQYKNVDRYLALMHKWLGISTDELGTMKDKIINQIKTNLEAESQQPRDWGIIEEIVKTASQHGVPVASHDDDTPEKVTRQASIGIKISEFPVTLEAATMANQHNMAVIMGAPNAYRGQSTSDNLSAIDAIQAGFVKGLASDYYPASMIQTAFLLAKSNILPLHESIKLVSTYPADTMGLLDRGRIEVGKRADLVLVSAEDTFPRVRGTIQGGMLIYLDSYLASATQFTSLFEPKDSVKLS